MTKLLEQAISKAKALPEDRQDEVGEIILSLVDEEQSELRLSVDQIAEVRRRIETPEPIATAEELKSFFHRLEG